MRFALMTTGGVPHYIAAAYDFSSAGILFTNKVEDACSYGNFDKAVSVARSIENSLGFSPTIVSVEN